MTQLQERSSGRQIHSLFGMSDLDTQTWRRSDDVLAGLRSHMRGWEYHPIDTPLLEETELFVRKAGGDLAGQLYNFTDPGGTPVSLRPEFTSSVIRHYIDNEQSLTPPVRWQYSGPVFRYEAAGQDSYRQFTQCGAEIVGASGFDADIEVISLAVSGLGVVGLNDFRLRIGHLGVLRALLGEFGLSEPARLFIIGNIDALRTGEADVQGLMAHAREVGLLSGGVDIGLGLETALESMSAESAEQFILGVLKESMPEPLGRRATDQIIARMLSKMRNSNCPDAFEHALSLAAVFSRLAGQPCVTLQSARDAIESRGVDAAPLAELESLAERLPELGIAESRITLDMGMARGISYYTGIVFEIVHDSGAAIGGGGRYDDLVQALGGSASVPAMGFAYNVNVLLDLLPGDARAVNGVVADGV